MLNFENIDALLESNKTTVTNSNELVNRSNSLIVSNQANRTNLQDLVNQYNQITEEITSVINDLELRVRALMLIGSATDKSIEDAINKVTGVINHALALLFPKDRRAVSIRKTLYRNSYLHFEVILETGKGNKRSFKMSGTGLAQIVSCLFNIAFLDISGSRKVLVMDEVLNGLHPKAKMLMRELLVALRDYQFIIIEHNMDIGSQYEAVKEGQRSFIRKYNSNNYYTDFVLKANGHIPEEEESSIMVNEEGKEIYTTDNTVADLM